MKRVLIIDNFDSFTFNLVQQIGALGGNPIVYRNNESHSLLLNVNPSHLVISPGPGNPSHTGISRQMIEHFQGRIPILGVCLGLQLIGEIFGAKVVRAPRAVHGKMDEIVHKGVGVFEGLPSPTKMARYHSLVLERENWPCHLEETAWNAEGLVMGIRHREIPRLEGVQFHPESFMSEEGDRLMGNFLA